MVFLKIAQILLKNLKFSEYFFRSTLLSLRINVEVEKLEW